MQKTIPWLLAATPLFWLAVFATFVARARLALGRWPVANDPDPKALGFDAHHAMTVVGVPLTVAAVAGLMFVALLAWSRPRQADPRLGRAALIGVAGLVAVVALARLDPGGIFTWFGD